MLYTKIILFILVLISPGGAIRLDWRAAQSANKDSNYRELTDKM